MNSSVPMDQQSRCEPTVGDSGKTDPEESESESTDSLEALIEETKDKLDGDKVTIGNLLDSFQSRGFGPLLLIPALISVSPLGTIPGMSAITGTLILVIAVQMLFRSGHPWTPKSLQKVSFSRERFNKSVDEMSSWIKWIDRLISKRWAFMVTGPMHYVIAVAMVLLSLTYYPLAVVPFGVMLPGTAMVFFALGLTSRDGYLITIGLIATGGAFLGMVGLWPF